MSLQVFWVNGVRQPEPTVCSTDKPVYSSHWRLTKSTEPSGNAVQVITGIVSITLTKLLFLTPHALNTNTITREEQREKDRARQDAEPGPLVESWRNGEIQNAPSSFHTPLLLQAITRKR